ncbi:hypothetical protein F4801DRAFT_424933 [Xylaria longipes]|nr:hypothetical protein F4801DRAFT_424933 [Xylaria longipes]
MLLASFLLGLCLTMFRGPTLFASLLWSPRTYYYRSARLCTRRSYYKKGVMYLQRIINVLPYRWVSENAFTVLARPSFRCEFRKELCSVL